MPRNIATIALGCAISLKRNLLAWRFLGGGVFRKWWENENRLSAVDGTASSAKGATDPTMVLFSLLSALPWRPGSELIQHYTTLSPALRYRPYCLSRHRIFSKSIPHSRQVSLQTGDHTAVYHEAANPNIPKNMMIIGIAGSNSLKMGLRQRWRTSEALRSASSIAFLRRSYSIASSQPPINATLPEQFDLSTSWWPYLNNSTCEHLLVDLVPELRLEHFLVDLDLFLALHP